MTDYKYIIIGAGLSGLTTAYELLKRGINDFVILEGRNRVGGRILSANGIDMGPTWLHQPHNTVRKLCSELGLALFDQYNSGKSMMVYDMNSQPHFFEADPREPASSRIEGGTFALIEALWNQLTEKINLNTEAFKVKEDDGELVIETNSKTYSTEKVVITIPPSLASFLKYEPELPTTLKSVMASKHTWMSNSIKFGISYNKPFWREKGLSGTIVGQAAPVVELYDHTSNDSKIFALMGFVNEALRKVSLEERKNIILVYLERYFGVEIRQYAAYEEKDWSLDNFTQKGEVIPRYIGANYGDACFGELYMNGKLLFSGTETAPQHGGYLEGAVISGVRAAELLLK